MLSDGSKHRMFDLLSCNQLTRVVFLGCVQQAHL
nr:MAG TPA: hypothetical protein [Caudoviricetes sp.]